MKECTFQPKINSIKQNPNTIQGLLGRRISTNPE